MDPIEWKEIHAPQISKGIIVDKQDWSYTREMVKQSKVK